MSFFIGFADELMKLAEISYIDTRRKTKTSGVEGAKKTTPELRKAQLVEKYKQQKRPPKPPQIPANMPVSGT
jgi:hypothetical protein